MAGHQHFSKTPATVISSSHEVPQMQELENYYRDISRRDVSPRMKSFCHAMAEICRLATNSKATTLRPEQWETLAKVFHRYSERRDEVKAEDDQRLRQYQSFARLADYSMIRCKDLKDADGNWSFKKQPWVQVVQRLDAEENALRAWEAKRHHDPNSTSPPPPAQIVRQELLEAMMVIGENDQDQMLWEIRFYARRNGRLHGDAIELRHSGDFDTLSKVLDEDAKSLEEILPDEEKLDIQHHKRAIVRYRMRWFDFKEVDPNGKLVWIPNASALKWKERIEKEARPSFEIPRPRILAIDKDNFLHTDLVGQRLCLSRTLW